MNRGFWNIPMLALLLAALLLSVTPLSGGQQQKEQPKSQAKQGASMTGCIDQQDGIYVLTDVRNLAPIATLEADGFPTESFAKHVGHHVTVRGASRTGSTLPVFKVRSIDTIRDTCGPQQK